MRVTFLNFSALLLSTDTMLTLTGSRALGCWFADARKATGDWDYISPYDLPCADDIPDSWDVFIDSRLASWKWGPVANPDELYTMKISHSFWEINGPRDWNKHASDIVFLSRKGTQFIRPLYEILLPIWKERYRAHPTNLNQSSEQFFSDAVNRKYDHDSVHVSIAYGDVPLYVSILREDSDVAVDNGKFWSMDHYTQIRLVREEIYATALERILIPAHYQGSPSAAYHWALRRTATSLFKNEWALFILRNLDELMKPDCDYVRRHLSRKNVLIPIGER